jgi:ATP-dependent protease ClpP protease subunit
MPIATTLDAKAPMIRLTGEIDMPVSYALLDEIKLLHDYYQFRTIDLHIDSPGGSADALHYLVHALDPWRKGEGRVLRTFGVNEVASAAALLLSFGTVGYRTASSRSRLLYHSVRSVQRENSMQTVAQLRVATRRLEHWDHCFVDLLVEHTLACGTLQSRDGAEAASYRKKLSRLMRKEKFITPEQALELKLIDRIQESGTHSWGTL